MLSTGITFGASLILVLASLVFAAPVDSTDPSEFKLGMPKPMKVTNVFVYSPVAGSRYPASLSFHVKDINDGHEFEQTCTRVVKADSSLDDDATTYHKCGGDNLDNALRFRYSGGTLTLMRYWKHKDARLTGFASAELDSAKWDLGTGEALVTAGPVPFTIDSVMG